MIRSTRRRAGFTLIEVLLASVIAVMLLGGLYMMFDVTIRQTEEARDVVGSASLARNVFQRMAIDLSCTLAPLPPRSGGNDTGSTAASSTGSTGTDTTGTGTGTGTGTTGTGTTGTDTGTGTTGTSTDAMGETIEGTTGVASDLSFQGGVYGTESRLTIFVSQVPLALADSNTFTQIASGNSANNTYSDLVKVTYWLAGTGQGLCRQEQRGVTADGVRDNQEPDKTNELNDIVADDVTGVSFEYFHPSDGWVTSWDGSVKGDDGVTPVGPPRAVRVTLTVSIPSVRPNQPPLEKTVKQVIPIRTAPGSSTPAPLDTETTTDMTGGGM